MKRKRKRERYIADDDVLELKGIKNVLKKCFIWGNGGPG